MTPDRLQQVRSLFKCALEQEPQQRSAFLQQACEDDPELLKEVQRLLTGEAQGGRFPDEPDRIPVRTGSTLSLTVSQANKIGRCFEEGRFLPGTLLAGRYRFISLLGRGGMGEVYRAQDIKLGQPVALKFLSESAVPRGSVLERFYSEVRIARQISHPNVCRTYDIGEVDGHHFVSMEYIDGEDLASLLRRIGHLPSDKATDLARGLCAGLAAAHSKGILHRDLKPANVMIDGRGQVRITDFGLAGLAGEFEGAEVRDGTPAYMAPEQLAGREVSYKSDIYSLGLVLYEMFTGRRAFEARSFAELISLQKHSSFPTPSSVVKGLDPVVEQLILRCLEVDPRHRPASALSVAAALPGEGPLAAALAAGETPSPDIVAHAEEPEGLHPAVALFCLVVLVAGLFAVAVLNNRLLLLKRIPFELSPRELAVKARDILQLLNYREKQLDRAFGFVYDSELLRFAALPANRRVQQYYSTGRPSPVQFWYRESPTWLEVYRLGQLRVSLSDPPPIRSGMVSLKLDTQGRLLHFSAVPQHVNDPSSPARSVDWSALFSAAGLDMAQFQPVEPGWAPPLVASDTRAAWRGAFPEVPEYLLRIEAAAWRGRPVYLDVMGPWSGPTQIPRAPPHPSLGVIRIVLATIILLPLAAGWLAYHNVRRGRDDRRGATRLAAFVFLVNISGFVLSATYIPTVSELDRVITWISYAGFTAALVWLGYVALEPFVRRRWPQVMISWTQALAGRIRDPRIGRDLLIGILFGVAIEVLQSLVLLKNGDLRRTFSLDQLGDLRHTLGHFLNLLPASIGVALGFFLVFFAFRVLLRKAWVAGCGFICFFAGMSVLVGGSVTSIVFSTVEHALIVVMLLRFGALSLVAAIFVSSLLQQAPLMADLGEWYGSGSLLLILAITTLAVWASRRAVAGRPWMPDELL